MSSLRAEKLEIIQSPNDQSDQSSLMATELRLVSPVLAEPDAGLEHTAQYTGDNLDIYSKDYRRNSTELAAYGSTDIRDVYQFWSGAGRLKLTMAAQAKRNLRNKPEQA